MSKVQRKEDTTRAQHDVAVARPSCKIDSTALYKTALCRYLGHYILTELIKSQKGHNPVSSNRLIPKINRHTLGQISRVNFLTTETVHTPSNASTRGKMLSKRATDAYVCSWKYLVFPKPWFSLATLWVKYGCRGPEGNGGASCMRHQTGYLVPGW